MASRKLFHDSVVELPPQAGTAPTGLNVHAASAEHGEELMTVSFSLSGDKAKNDELEARVARGEVLPAAEVQTRYGAPEDKAQKLVRWLKDQHFKILEVTPDHTAVYAQATASDVARALQVELVRVTNDGVTYTSARNAPSLPDDVAESVRAIGGLQPHRHMRKHLRRSPGARRSATSGHATSALGENGCMVKQILQAYQADALQFTGAGQVIAIVIDTGPKASDMSEFWKANGMAVTPDRIEVVNVNSAKLDPPTGEETLDAQWTSGIASGAHVRIYATGSLQFTDIDRALDRILADAAKEPGLRQVSMSLGLGETYMAPGDVKTEHAKFLRLAAAGINVFVSTGDAGSNPDSGGQHSGGPLQVEYESSDPCVIAVGGTTLKLAKDKSVREMGWAAGGGGKSKYFPRPAWQEGKGITGSTRMVPDISATADPNYGGYVFLNGEPVPGGIGGTSWSAPIWAGLCALMNEARAGAGKPALPFLNPLLYGLKDATCLRDITSGSNGAYDAGSGYDMVTGLGVPNVKALVQHLTK